MITEHLTIHPRRWNPGEPDRLEALQIVYKVAERCNINCSYCYYFNMGDSSALERPAKVDVAGAVALADWLARGCAELRIPRVLLAFHGGEPMLVGPRRMDEICGAIRQRLEPDVEVQFSMQTNGTILSREWLQVLRRHGIGVGVSIDGRRADHDRHRLGHRGESTFDRTEATIRALVAAADGDRRLLPSTISVLHHEVDYDATYRYLRGLGVRSMSFLLPDRSRDDTEFAASGVAARYGAGMAQLLAAWLAEDDPSVSVRFIDEALRHLKAGNTRRGSRRRKDVQILIARSDGTVVADDSYTPALEWYARSPVAAIADTSLREVLSHPIFGAIEEQMQRLPTECSDCEWRVACRGGDLENRYSHAKGFDNPSIYCDAYKTFYTQLCDLLVRNGYPADELHRRLEAA